MSLFVRTATGGASPDFLIEDLGFNIITGATWKPLSFSSNLGPGQGAGQFTDIELKDSLDLYTAIVGGQLEWSTDGTTVRVDTYDADIAFVLDLSNNDFNLTNGKLVVPNRTSPPATLRPGELYYDTDDGYLVFYDGYQLQYMSLSEGGAITQHSALGGLGNDDHLQYLLLNGSATRNTATGTINLTGGRIRLPSNVNPTANFTTPIAGEIAYDSDDGYLVYYSGSSWLRAGTNLPHALLSGLGADDHPQYFHLSQNETILGTPTFNPSITTAPAFVITPDISAPTTLLVDGSISLVDGMLYAYDATRAKWLSVHRDKYMASRNGIATSLYLRVGDGVAMSNTGIRMSRNGTITSLSAQTDGVETWTFEVRKNNSVLVLASLVLTAVSGGQINTINVDVASGDELQFFCNGTAVDFPVAMCEIAWRI